MGLLPRRFLRRCTSPAELHGEDIDLRPAEEVFRHLLRALASKPLPRPLACRTKDLIAELEAYPNFLSRGVPGCS